MALVFTVMHHMSSYVSINSRNTLDSYRMNSFFPGFPNLSYVFCSFHGVFSILKKREKRHNGKMPLEECEKVTKMGTNRK